MDETDDLTDALNKFVEIKKQYLKELHINPCMIIQVSNKDKADSEIEKIKETLNTKFNDLKWMYLLDKLEKKRSNKR